MEIMCHWHADATAMKQRRRHKEGLKLPCSAPWWEEDWPRQTLKHRGSEGQLWGGLDSEGPARHELAQQLWKPRPGLLQVRPSHGAPTNFQRQQRLFRVGSIRWQEPFCQGLCWFPHGIGLAKRTLRRTRLVQKLQEWHLLAKGLLVKAIDSLAWRRAMQQLQKLLWASLKKASKRSARHSSQAASVTYSSKLTKMTASASTVLQRQLRLLKLHSWVAGLRSRNMAGTPLCGMVREELARWHGTSLWVQGSTVPC